MTKEQNPNLEMLSITVDYLGELVDELVFLGGSATGLLITDSAAPTIRVTKDVDVISQVTTKAAYYRLGDKLREQGFTEDASDDAPICRWRKSGVLLDVMPIEPTVLGFGNKWYGPAMDAAVSVELPSGKKIRMVSAPYFLITKLEAFNGRGKGDYLMSHDIEDFIAVIDGRPDIIEEALKSDNILLCELADRCKVLLADSRFIDAVYGHMPTDETSQARVSMILKKITQLAEYN